MYVFTSSHSGCSKEYYKRRWRKKIEKSHFVLSAGMGHVYIYYIRECTHKKRNLVISNHQQGENGILP